MLKIAFELEFSVKVNSLTHLHLKLNFLIFCILFSNQVGPYVYQEYHHKFDEVWFNNNASVTYKQKIRWIPISKNMEDRVTILNVPLASVGALAEKLPKVTRMALNFGFILLGTFKMLICSRYFFHTYIPGFVTSDQKLFVTKTAREILFDGYNDPILNIIDDLKNMGFTIPGEMPSKFGFYFGRNDTWYGNGIGKSKLMIGLTLFY